ncbi:phosphoethanolamine N-methyltransferase-like [Glandiceps talaboti]
MYKLRRYEPSAFPTDHDVGRVYKELEELGYGRNDELKLEDLVKVDQYTYNELEAIDDALNVLSIQSNHRILDVGSGLGGPARYIANTTKCHVTALDIQPELNDIAQDLTRRCNLNEYVTHICDDFLTADLDANKYDFLVSWLAMLHIPKKQTIYDACFKYIKPGGTLYVEDLVARRKLTESEEAKMLSLFFSPGLLTKDGYKECLQKAGFVDVQITDMTENYIRFTKKRYEQHMHKMDQKVRLMGQDITRELESFYWDAHKSYVDGLMGGIRITAIKPC